MKNIQPLFPLSGSVPGWLRFFVVAALFWTSTLLAAPAQAGVFTGQHYANESLSDTPVTTSQTNSIDYDWGTGSPSGLPADSFSNRWTATIPCSGGSYTFHVRADDGVRLYVDGTLVINAWVLQTSQEGVYSQTRTLSAGNHTIVLEHFEHTGVSSIHLDWEVPGSSGEIVPITGAGDGVAQPPAPILLKKTSCTATSTSVHLEWTGGQGSDVYHIKRRYPYADGSSPYIEVATVALPNQFACTFNANDSNSLHEYIVIGSSGSLDTPSDTVILPKPYPLTNFSITSASITGTTVALGWSPAVTVPTGRDDWRYVIYKIKRRPKNSTTPWAQIPVLQQTSDYGLSFTVDSATVPYEYIVVATDTTTTTLNSLNTVILPKPRVWTAGTPLGQYKDGTGTTIYDGRMTAPVDQSVAGFQPATSYIVPGSVVPCTVEVASDIDSWTKAADNGGASTTGTDADTIAATDYVWSFTGGAAGEGFRARGSNGAVSATFVGREADFVVSPSSPVDTTYNLTCTISNDHPKAIASEDEGARTDADIVRTQQLKITASSSALKVYRQGAAATSTAPITYNELGNVIGGEVYVALHIDLGVNDRVTSTKARVRLQELPDTANGVTHAVTEDHVDVVVALNDKAGWQEFYDPDGTGPKVLGWWAARKAPSAVQTANSQFKYRYLIRWVTTEVRNGDRFDVNQNQSGKVLGHNGNHKIAISSVDNVIGAPVAFLTAGTAQTASSFAKTVELSNLAITNVSTSNGTSDYFKFDPTAPDGSALKSPTISFKIRDDGDPHRYAWSVRVRSTDSEKWDGVAIGGTSNPGETITARINNFTTPGQTQVGDEDSASNEVGNPKSITKWGTYSFDIEVREVDNSGVLLGDAQNLRSKLFLPYNMPVKDAQGNFLPGHGGELIRGADGIDRYYVNYYIKDEGTLTPTQPALKDLQIQTLPPDLGAPVATSPVSWDKNVNTAYTDQLLKTFTTPREPGVYITTFIGTDNYKAFYRDHQNRQTLTKNDREDGFVNLINDTRNGDRVVSAKDSDRGLPGGEKILHIQIPANMKIQLKLAKKSGANGAAVFGGQKLPDGTRADLGVTLPLTGTADPNNPNLAAIQEVAIMGRSVSSIPRNMGLSITAADGTNINWLLNGTAVAEGATWDFTVFRVDVTPYTSGSISQMPASVLARGGAGPGTLRAVITDAANSTNLGKQLIQREYEDPQTQQPFFKQEITGTIIFRGQIVPSGMNSQDFNSEINRLTSFDWDRTVWSRRYKTDDKLLSLTNTTLPSLSPKFAAADSLSDNESVDDKDLRPDSDGTANELYIWCGDSPSLSSDEVPSNGDIIRLRTKFKSLVTYERVPVSKEVPWTFRASMINPPGDAVPIEDISYKNQGDNAVAANGSTAFNNISLAFNLGSSQIGNYSVTGAMPTTMLQGDMNVAPGKSGTINGTGLNIGSVTRVYGYKDDFGSKKSLTSCIELGGTSWTISSSSITGFWNYWGYNPDSAVGEYVIKVIKDDSSRESPNKIEVN